MNHSREFDFIESLRALQRPDSRVPIGIGDDTAVLFGGPRDWLATVDMLVERVHFDFDQMRPKDVGRKALAVNLSDIAAMAGEPVAALVAVAIPRGAPARLAEELLEGIQRLAEEFDVSIIGGDTNATRGGVVVSITLLGHPTGKGPVLRSGAKPGDVLCVTGRLGYSLSGHHWRFTPRVREAQLLQARYAPHAMIDISDGLASDVFHIARESRCGIEIDLATIPISEPTVSDGASKLTHALNDGEDFELLFCLSPAEAARLLQEQPLGVPVTAVGRITKNKEVIAIDGNGKRQRLEPGGYVHEW